MIDSDWLRAFASFASDPNLSRTAARLHLSQPAVHAQLRRLSETLGVPLYQRAGRGLVLTQEGVEVAAFARDAEERADDLVRRLRGDAGTERRVVLAAGAGALLHVLGEGIRAFTRSYEGRLDLVTADASAAIAAVVDGSAHVGIMAIDAGARPAKDTRAELTGHRLTEVAQHVVVPRDHRLARRKRVALGDLDGERLVMPPVGRPQRNALDAAFAAQRVRVVPSAQAVGWELTLRLVELGAGIAVVNASVAIPGGLVALPVPELPRVGYLALTRQRPRPDVKRLVDALVAHADAWRRVARKT